MAAFIFAGPFEAQGWDDSKPAKDGWSALFAELTPPPDDEAFAAAMPPALADEDALLDVLFDFGPTVPPPLSSDHPGLHEVPAATLPGANLGLDLAAGPAPYLGIDPRLVFGPAPPLSPPLPATLTTKQAGPPPPTIAAAALPPPQRKRPHPLTPPTSPSNKKRKRAASSPKERETRYRHPVTPNAPIGLTNTRTAPITFRGFAEVNTPLTFKAGKKMIGEYVQVRGKPLRSRKVVC